MAANMLTAYYSSGCDSRQLFHGLRIESDPNYETHLNQYNVIHLNIASLLSATTTAVPSTATPGALLKEGIVAKIKRLLLLELLQAYPDGPYLDSTDLLLVVQNIWANSGRKFIVIIDEWDCLFREFNKKADQKTVLDDQETYLNFLRGLFKDNPAITLCYMTGILPIKKYGTHSALNMFTEVSMLDPRGLSEFMGFTDSEVRDLCERYHLDYAEMAAWYNGYQLENNLAIYSPLFVVQAAQTHNLKNYWNETETYEALQDLIRMNFDGLKDTVTNLIAGIRKAINTKSFKNDMTTFSNADDVLTLLVHLGYLAYDQQTSEVFIPNSEVHEEFITSIEGIGWEDLAQRINRSEQLIQQLWAQDSVKVAAAIELEHDEFPSLVNNSEESLASSVLNAFFSVNRLYTIYRELPAGKGFADLVFVPKPIFANIPAILIEHKWNKSAQGAIAQISNKQYFRGLEAYKNNLLLVGINYSKKTRKHTCVIEKFVP
jgi:hypothetical protein